MPVITIGRQIGAGGSSVGHMVASRLKIDFLDSQLIDEVAKRLQLPKEEVEAEDEQPGSLLSRLLLALGAANAEPIIPPETSAWNPPNTEPVFDTRQAVRSEEHTSELQSRFELVCRLLLEKKKKNEDDASRGEKKRYWCIRLGGLVRM